MEINLPISPPVNNNIQGNIYDKLDAITFEKVRIANSLLDTRRTMQEKVINKYRKDVEKVHMHQKERLKREFKKIRTKKPDYHFDEQDSTSKSRDRSQDGGRQRSLSDSSNSSFCHRYYAHHYNYKDRTRSKRKEEDKSKNNRQNDHFNMTLRLFFVNMMNHAQANMTSVQNIDRDHELETPSHQRDINRIHVKPLSYDPRYPDGEREKLVESKRSRSIDALFKEDDDVCDELKDLDNGESSSDENDVFESSLNTSKLSLNDSFSTLDKPKMKPKLSHSLNVPSCTSIPEESRIDIKEDKELWKRSKRAFEKIFTGLL